MEIHSRRRRSKEGTKERVLVTDCWLDMDTKYRLNPVLVQSLSNLCPCTDSIQSPSKPGPNTVNPPKISSEDGQTLDLNMQSLSVSCPTKCKFEKKPDRTNSGHRLDLQKCGQGSHFGFSENEK